jgi:Cdc6-like AAA superfamily ATPase
MPPNKVILQAMVSQAFTPSAPVDDVRLFADRPDQTMACIQAFFQKGRHIALYGERGVGKTSLANIVPEIVRNVNVPSMRAIRVDCNVNDNFNTIWRKIFRELGLPDAEALSPSRRSVDPEEIRFLLKDVPGQTLIVIDEFDRVDDDDALSLLADTVKTLSDHSSAITLMFVGVANSVTTLLGEHESIVRNVEQVPMPRMSREEMVAILTRGFETLDDLSIEPAAREQIVSTAEGLPHFVHVLALNATLSTVSDDRFVVEAKDVDRAEDIVMRTHSMATQYRDATQSPQPGHLFVEVLLACAFAPRDGEGRFRAADLKKPLSKIVGKEMDYPNFNRHLTELSSEKRRALRKEGSSHNWVYQFKDPLLQPFVKMVGRSTGLISPKLSAELARDQQNMTAPSFIDG